MPTRGPVLRHKWVSRAAVWLSAALLATPGLGMDRREKQPGPVIAQPLRKLAARGPRASAALRAAGAVEGTRVRVRVGWRGDDPGLLRELQQAGMEMDRFQPAARAASGWVAVDRLRLLAAVAGVRRIDLPDRAIPQAGLVRGEHDALLGCAATRDAFGVGGAGVRIGVISDGIDHLADAQSTGDAPDVEVPAGQGCRRGRGDEGTAMIEILHDCAPAATIGFCGPGDDLGMIDCIRCLRDTWGADIIVDDLGFLLQPYFSDGPIAAEVDATAAAGVLYVSAAGNFAQRHYQGRYAPCGDTDPRHRFGPQECALTYESVGPSLVVLQWDDPQGASSRDYDLCVEGCDGRDCSEELQDGDDDPLEYVMCECPEGESCQVTVEVSRFSGEPAEIELLVLPLAGGGQVRGLTPAVAADSVFGHQCAEGTVAVAAVAASDPGNDDVQPFSSRGPCTLIAPTPVQRAKPSLAGIDGISNTRPGGFPSPFFGTSAAAPGVAAAAALLLELNPTARAGDILDALTASAVDIATPGPDLVSGAGRVDVRAAAGRLLPSPTPTSLPAATPTPGPCVADCDRNGTVSVNELVRAVSIALDRLTPGECLESDADGDGAVTVAELVLAVGAALKGCWGWP